MSMSPELQLRLRDMACRCGIVLPERPERPGFAARAQARREAAKAEQARRPAASEARLARA